MVEPTFPHAPANADIPDLRIGSYRILSPLGVGGMSSVFRAVHIDTNHEVALKVLTRSLARNPTLLQRFLREARSAETLEHPNIVSIYDRGIDQGRHYLVLEYAAGGDFHDYIQHHGPLVPAEAISVIRSVACGLQYAANQGLIHRDIKPSNILRTSSGQVKIIDLGLALQHEFEDERVTREGTTVGTVDYMAPEQARDSRATSIQSDIYSLGCTFYYLLAGVAPYPGGDITDKLTRHAKSPPPDIRDLRPDIPIELSTLLKRMMAKAPEDRFASYDDLLKALDSIPLDPTGRDDPSIALVPLEPDSEANSGTAAFESRASRRSEFGSNGSGDLSAREISLAELVADELPGERHLHLAARLGGLAPPAVLPRGSAAADTDEDEDPAATPLVPIQPAPPAWKLTFNAALVLPVLCVGAAFFLLGIGAVQYMNLPEEPNAPLFQADAGADVAPPETVVSPREADAAKPDAAKHLAIQSRHRPQIAGSKAQIQIPVHWVEPEDPEPPAEVDNRASPGLDSLLKILPEWARQPVPERIDGPFVVVRRVPGTKDAATVKDPSLLETSLHAAFDEHIGGTVEIADDGPLPIDDFRIAGESRLVRARPGFRPIIKLEGSLLDAVRRQQAVFVLDRRNLTLDGLDLVVNVADLPQNQTALFECTGVNLTLRNCSITILNHRPAGRAFTLLRTEASPARASRIRLERTLVRGPLYRGFDLTGGSVDLVLEESMILAGPGPLVRVLDDEAASEHRLYFLRSLLAGPGPIVEQVGSAIIPAVKPLVVRAEDSVFGRLHGTGIASVFSSDNPATDVRRQIDWVGQRNLLVDWKGFLASGPDHMVTLSDLAAVRSTWNGTDRDSQEVFVPWPHPTNLAETAPAELTPFILNHEAIARRVAQPRARFFERTLGAFTAEPVPEPLGWAFEAPATVVVPNASASRLLPPEMTDMGTAGIRRGSGTGQDLELTFSTDAPPWHGDLGGFLRDRLGTAKSARVRVIGSGPHRFSPVLLPRGLRLEIRVEPYAAAEPPSWSPMPQATGPALIELHEGTLILCNFVVRHDESSRLDHLIRIEDGHLVLAHCRITAPLKVNDFAGDLILFRSVTTQPRPIGPHAPFLSFPVDRPLCRITDSVLITGGTALNAELGRGQIALSQCAVAASVAALALAPSRVARDRFEADLSLDHCTLASDRSIIELSRWPGRAPGPDRPWLVGSRRCAFLAFDRLARRTVLLRSDADALAGGAVFWQVDDDATDLDLLVAAFDRPPTPARTREAPVQWAYFWGDAHRRRLIAPRAVGSPAIRFREKLRPGKIEPADLILDPRSQPERPEQAVGCDLARQGITPPGARNVRGRN